MQNLAVSSQLAIHGAKAQKADKGNPGEAAADLPAEDSPLAGKFGALLAKQIELAASPQDNAAVVAELRETIKQAAHGDDDGAQAPQDAAALLGMLPQSMVDPTMVPVQKILAAAAHAPAAAAPGLATALANISKTTGKELPVGDPAPAELAAAQALPKAADLSDVAVPEQSPFSALLAEKKVDTPLQAAVSAQDNPAAAQQVQAANLATGEKVSATNRADISIPQRVGAENWGTGLGDKVVWVVGNQMRGAEIHLNPPALGPLEVRVNITDGQANLSFMTHHASVREAIEAATPRLREMLGDNGIGMGSVSVNVGSFAQQQDAPQEQSRASWQAAFAEAGLTDESLTTFVQPLRGRGMVDFFA